MAGMTRIEMKPGPWRITDPNWPTFTPYDTKGIVLSDTFTGDGPLLGRATDSGIGGAPATWSGAGTATDWSTVGGVLRIRPGGVVVAGIPHTLTTFSLEVAVAGLPAAGGGNLWIEPWKAGTPTAAGAAALRMEITPTGSVTAIWRDNSRVDARAAQSGTIRAGDRITARVTPTELSVLVGGAVVSSVAHTQPLTTSHFAGMTKVAATDASLTSWVVRDGA